jgi:hypothetical protein
VTPAGLPADKPRSSGKRDVYPPAQQYPGESQTPAPGQYQPPAPSRSAAPVYSPPQDKPPIPSGWVPEWDQQYQRWYYHDTATGRSQWEAPGYVQKHDDRGVDSGLAYANYSGGGGHYSGHGGGEYGYPEEKREKKSSGYGGMMLGAAGGLVAGAVIADALGKFASSLLWDLGDVDSNADDSDDEGYRAPPPVPQSYPADLSESDRESIASAREDYEEALDDARSSSASSSDREELEEAREEYYEEVEEAYDD